MTRIASGLLSVLIILMNAVASEKPGQPNSEFVSASTVDKIRSQMRKLPRDDIWWTVNGDDMAWNFKNLHQIFPTVNVYRNGPVRELEQRPITAIGEFIVDTPKGPMSFDDFIQSGPNC